MHALPTAHLVLQLAPPQSMSVSTPFLTPSLQVGTWQTLPAQTPDEQPAALKHALPSAHTPQPELPPPQSTSASSPFLIPSKQLGTWQTSPVHTPDEQSPPKAQAEPLTHEPPHAGPPQSMSVSPPFFTPSLQVGTWQTLPVHTPDKQSLAVEHAFESAHAGQPPLPPQSTSVSSTPFLTPSRQVGAGHVPSLQTLDAQSEGNAHFLLSAQAAHVPPPQSLSVSAPFWTLSLQVGAWQTLPVHTPDKQSALVKHFFRSAHLPQLAPPQSTSTSSPFFTPSMQEGAWHTLLAQTPDEQSAATEQALPSAHAPQVGPPQSRSVSAPFLTLSWHVAGRHRWSSREQTRELHWLGLPQRTGVQSVMALLPAPCVVVSTGQTTGKVSAGGAPPRQ
jgi:hypothetical protein